jgi:hypothetical protein
LAQSDATLSVVACRFFRCISTYQAGAISAYPIRSGFVNLTCGIACLAGTFGAFFEIGIAATHLGSLQINVTSAIACQAPYNTFEAVTDSATGGSATTLHHVNSSANDAFGWGSGFLVLRHFVLSVQYCALFSNTGGSCLYLSSAIANSEMHHVHMYNNTCKSDQRVSGLIHILSDAHFFGSIFQENVADPFVGGPAGWFATFDRCVFSENEMSHYGSVEIKVTQCAVYETRTTIDPMRFRDCRITRSLPPGYRSRSRRRLLNKLLRLLPRVTAMMLLLDFAITPSKETDYVRLIEAATSESISSLGERL